MPNASKTPNPMGNKGKPFTLAPMKFDDALRKILAAPPEPKAVIDKPAKKKPVKPKK